MRLAWFLIVLSAALLFFAVPILLLTTELRTTAIACFFIVAFGIAVVALSLRIRLENDARRKLLESLGVVCVLIGGTVLFAWLADAQDRSWIVALPAIFGPMLCAVYLALSRSYGPRSARRNHD